MDCAVISTSTSLLQVMVPIEAGAAAIERVEDLIGVGAAGLQRLWPPIPGAALWCCSSAAAGKNAWPQPQRSRDSRNHMMDSSVVLAALDGKKYLNLETYRKSGKGVRTPVWFAVEVTPADAAAANTPKLYVYTTADSGKAKRIRQSSVVKIAPCDVRGTVTGQWIDAHAKIVSGEEFVRGMRLINRKYCPWKQILDLSALLFRRHERIMLAIRPV